MGRNRLAHLAALAALSSCVACGAATPTRPTSAPPVSPAPAEGGNGSRALSISAFSVDGWHADGQFHYLPNVSVVAAADGGSVEVQDISFERSDGGIQVPLSNLRYGARPQVPAGARLDLTLVPGRVTDIVSTLAIDRITVRVGFVDGTGRSGVALAEVAVPAVSRESPTATLAIRTLSVQSWYKNGRYHYWPRLTLAETTGRSHAVIMRIDFELLDVGPAGGVPPSSPVISVPAGAAVTLDEDDYGGPWLEIDSSANASRVSVVVSFVDSDRRGGSVRATTQVSP